MVAPSVGGEFGQLDDRVRDGITEVTDALEGGPLEIDRRDIDRAVDRAQDQIGADSGAIGKRLLSGALLVGELIAGALLALVLTFFFLKDGEYMWHWLTSFFSEPFRNDLRAIGDRGWDTLSRYLGGLAIVAACDTALISLVLVLVGRAAGGPAGLPDLRGRLHPRGRRHLGRVGLRAGRPGLARAPGDGDHGGRPPSSSSRSTATSSTRWWWAARCKLHPVTILLSVTTGGILAGVAGAFIAVPVAAVISSTIAYVRERPAAAPT